MIEHFIYQLLTNDAGVSALVGTKVYPTLLPQNPVFPCVGYAVEPTAENITFDGQGTNQAANIEIDCWAALHADALALGEAVNAAIKNYSGTLAGVQVDAIYIDSALTFFEDAAEKYRYSISATLHKR